MRGYVKWLLHLYAIMLSYLMVCILIWWRYPAYEGDLQAPCSLEVFQDPTISYGTLAVLFLLLCYFSLWQRKSERYGIAKWAERNNIFQQMELNTDHGLVFGKLDDLFVRSDKPLSVLVLAPPGTGKTAGIVIPSLLLSKNSVLVHDPKGELYQLTARSREEFSTVILFDAVADNERSHSARFNVFAKEMLPQNYHDIRPYISNIATILIKESKEDKFFATAGRGGFVFFAAWLIWQEGTTSFAAIRSKILSEEKIAFTIRDMIETDGCPQDIIEDGRALLIHAESDKQWAGVIATIVESLQVFADPRVAAATSERCDFTGELMRERCISVFLKVRDKDRERLAPLIAILFETIGTQLISSNPEPHHHKVTFIMDEFVRLGRLPIIKDLPSISRSYGLNTLFVAQDYGQIEEIYGREAVSIFETNCAYKIVFQQNNLMTAERISKLIGNSTEQKLSYSTDLKKFIPMRSGSTLSEEGLPLVTPQEIMRLDKSTCLILAQGWHFTPIKAEVALWFKDKLLLAKVNR